MGFEILIFLVYGLIALALFLQTSMALFLLMLKRGRMAHTGSYLIPISDWNTNVPPTLGILGTLISLGSLTLRLEDISLMIDVFAENFGIALQTTVVGGFVYVVNMGLDVIIRGRLNAR